MEKIMHIVEVHITETDFINTHKKKENCSVNIHDLRACRETD